jgi:hypothetical protein
MEKQIGEILPKLQHQQTEDYSHIELTEDEVKQALEYKRMLKARAMDHEQMKQQRIDKVRKAQEPWTYEQLKTDVLTRAKQLPFPFVIDKDNQLAFEMLCLYFSNNVQFEDYALKLDDLTIHYKPTGDGYSFFKLNKGIGLFSGTKGTGKTVLMELFARNKRMPYINITTDQITFSYKRKGDDAIEVHSRLLHVGEMAATFYHHHVGICYQDLGRERDKKNYGDHSNVMADILFRLEDNYKSTDDYSPFHFTSNLDGPGFEDRYDDAIRSRMRKMFNFIELPGKDRRK